MPGIRRATREDLPAVLALLAQMRPAFEDMAPGIAEAVWERMLADALPAVFLAEHDARVVSTCTLAIVPNLTHGGRPYGVIENVVTDERHRRCGHGTAVLRRALDHAWAAGCYKVTLTTGSTRESTLRFYEQAGFARGSRTAFLARSPYSR